MYPPLPRLLSGLVWSRCREGGREECFLGGRILWLTSNFLSSRTKVAGKLHPSLPQRFINSQRKHKKLHSCGRHVGGAICELIPVLIWASACRGGGGLPLWSSKGASRLQRPLVGFNFLLKKIEREIETFPLLIITVFLFTKQWIYLSSRKLLRKRWIMAK